MLDFWFQIGKVVWIDALLSGDNALVIAMACRSLPAKQRTLGMIFGALAAVLMRIACTGGVSQLLEFPYLKAIGAIALIYVAVKMCLPDEGETNVRSTDRLLHAIYIVVMADIVMSIDNMVAVAAVAQGNFTILAIGLFISIPMIVAGAAAITYILNEYKILIWAGAALLGWIAGELFKSDAAIPSITDYSIIYGFIGACIVLILAFTLPYYEDTDG